jgi:hypothetical protein
MNAKKTLLSSLTSLLLSANLMAADLCVNESGSGGCFSTITAAIAAANDGDRILIQPKAGNAPYVEVLNINKSIQLLSNQEGVMWGLSGTITITPAAGRTISILHMRSNTGNITASGNSPSGQRCKVNIMNCQLLDGYINFNFNNFDVNVVSTIINNGYVALKYGNLIGNQISANDNNNMYATPNNYYCLVFYNSDLVATNDTLYIVGNIINNNQSANTYTPFSNISLNSNAQFFYVSNNYLKISNAFTLYSGSNSGIRFEQHKTSTLGTNCVYNNTMYNQTSNTYNSINIVSSTSGLFDIMNNLSVSPNINNASSHRYTTSGTPTVAFSYNFLAPHGTLENIVNNGTNNLSSNTTINITSGQINTGSDGINGGFPDLTYYDLDLTVNDVGAYGGSFSLTNFHPITGAARVYFVKAPRAVLQSGTLNIKAEAFDR